MRPRNIFIAAVISLFAFNACDSYPEPVIYEDCQITSIFPSGDTSNTSTSLQYDSQNRLVHINYAGPNSTSFQYNAGKIKIFYPSDPSIYTMYYLQGDSVALGSSSYSQGNRTDTAIYLYDMNGYLVKAVRYNNVFGKDSSFLTYQGGNLSSIITYLSNGAVEQVHINYTSVPAKSWFYQNFASYLHFSFYYPWLGKRSANLVQSFTSTYNGNPQPVTFDYIMDPSGYVNRYTEHFLGSSSVMNYRYTCR